MFFTAPYSLAALGLLASLASAVPTKFDEKVAITEAEVRDIEKRAQGNYQDYVPGCDPDPSYAPGKSHFNDGVGVVFHTGCDNGFNLPTNRNWHCWTDFFLVEWGVEYRDWQNTGQVIDCKTTQSCNEMVVNLNQTCVTNTQSTEDGVEASLEASLPKLLGEKLNIGAGFTYKHNWSNSKSVQVCTAESNTGTCTWADQDCHAIWSAKRTRRVFGYKRRSCNSPRTGDDINMSNSPQRPDGYYTVGMQDFDISIPDNQVIGCAAKCNDYKYPDPQPGGPSEMTPVESLG